MRNPLPKAEYVLKSLLVPLMVVFTSIAVLNWAIFYTTDKLKIDLFLSEPSLGSIFTASVALASLYIAWNNFIFKRKPFVKATWDIEHNDGQEEVYLKMINMGETNIGLQGFEWSKCEEWDDGRLHFSNQELDYFEKDHLKPGQETREKLGEDLIVFKINSLPIQKVDGETVELDTALKDRPQVRLHKLSDTDRDIQSGVQRFFRGIQDIDHQLGTMVAYEEFKEKSADELTKEHKPEETYYSNRWRNWKHLYESNRYGISVAGILYDDKISEILFWLAERRTRKDRKKNEENSDSS